MQKDERTFGEKISDSIAKFGSSWNFIFSSIAIILFWITINSIPLFAGIRFDGYPFILLNLFLSLIAAFQAPFIMMAQRRCEIKQDAIYRSLFQEIKDAVQSIVEKNEKLEKELEKSKQMLEKLSKSN
jgi:uncharacterized membrane protein